MEAFFAAAHEGDFEQLVAVLDPDVVLRADGGAKRPGASLIIRGPKAVATRAVAFSRLSLDREPVRSTAPRESSPSRTVAHSRSWVSPSSVRRSSRWTYSPTPTAFATPTSRASTGLITNKGDLSCHVRSVAVRHSYDDNAASQHWPMTLKLSARQVECLRLASYGQTSPEIARSLGIAPRTVDQHLAIACARLGVRNRIQAVASAAVLGIFDVADPVEGRS